MQPTNIAIAILSVLDGALLLLLPALDKQLYKNYPNEPARLFFINMGYDTPFHRFVYSRFGTLLISVIFIEVIFLTKRYGHGDW